MQAALFDGLRATTPEPLAADFSERVVAEFAATEKSSRRRPWAVGLAAVAALAASWMLITLPGGRSPVTPTLTTDGGLASVHPGVTAREPSSDSSVPEYPEDALDAEEYRLVLQELIARLSVAHFENLESVDQIAGGFRPLAVTLNAAFDVLRRSLPGSGGSETGDAPGDSAAMLRNPSIG